jgi:hypothetical protein
MNKISTPTESSATIPRTRDAPDNPALFDIRYPAGYQIALPDIL